MNGQAPSHSLMGSRSDPVRDRHAERDQNGIGMRSAPQTASLAPPVHGDEEYSRVCVLSVSAYA